MRVLMDSTSDPCSIFEAAASLSVQSSKFIALVCSWRIANIFRYKNAALNSKTRSPPNREFGLHVWQHEAIQPPKEKILLYSTTSTNCLTIPLQQRNKLQMLTTTRPRSDLPCNSQNPKKQESTDHSYLHRHEAYAWCLSLCSDAWIQELILLVRMHER